MKTIWELFDLKVNQYSNNTAIICDQERLTYSELGRIVSRFTRFLLKSGINYQDRVAIFLPNNPLFVISFFALTKIGAVAVTLNINYKEEELRSYLKICKVKYIILDKQRKETYARALKGSLIETIIIDSDFDLDDTSLKELNNQSHGIKADSDDEVIWQFSSGSTGKPKIVSRTHLNILKEAENISKTIKIYPRDKTLCAVPLFHAYGFGSAMMAAIYSGATLIILDKFTPRKILNILEKEKVTIFFGVPYMFSILANIDRKNNIKLPHLRYCFSAGISLPKEFSERFCKKFGIYVRDLYGTSETGCICINLNKHIKDTLHSVGTPIEGAKVEIVLDDNKRAKVGQIGEITVKTLTCAKRYYINNIAKPLLKKGYFYTGDLGKKDKLANLYITGRKTSFINVAGSKVDPIEVEEVIKRYPGVKEVIIVGSPNKLHGEVVKAVIVSNGRPVDKKELLVFCREKMADFKIPRVVEFRDKLPKSSLGKILQSCL